MCVNVVFRIIEKCLTSIWIWIENENYYFRIFSFLKFFFIYIYLREMYKISNNKCILFLELGQIYAGICHFMSHPLCTYIYCIYYVLRFVVQSFWHYSQQTRYNTDETRIYRFHAIWMYIKRIHIKYPGLWYIRSLGGATLVFSGV